MTNPPHGGEFGHGNRCPKCDAQFTTEAMLQTHMELHDATPEEEQELLEEQKERRP